MTGEPRPPLVAIVSSADIAREGTLNARYWTSRLDGSESYVAFKLREKIEDLERRAEGHDMAAIRLRAESDRLRALMPEAKEV